MAKILFIGPPGSGKDEQSKRLFKYGFIQLSSGDLIRKSTDPKIIEYREKIYPLLLPDNELFQLLEKSLKKIKDKYILDGFVRTVPQAKYVKEKGLVDLVFYFKVSKKTSIERILKGNRGRTDDNPKAIEKRFAEYKEKTEPALRYLRRNFEFYEIDAEPKIEEIHKEVLKILGMYN